MTTASSSLCKLKSLKRAGGREWNLPPSATRSLSLREGGMGAKVSQGKYFVGVNWHSRNYINFMHFYLLKITSQRFISFEFFVKKKCTSIHTAVWWSLLKLLEVYIDRCLDISISIWVWNCLDYQNIDINPYTKLDTSVVSGTFFLFFSCCHQSLLSQPSLKPDTGRGISPSSLQ